MPDTNGNQNVTDGATSSQELLLTRVISLAVLIIAVDFWVQKHLGAGITDPGWLAGISAMVATAIGLVERTLREQEKERFGHKLHDFLRRLLSFRIQAVLYLLVVTIALTLSTIVVISDDVSSGSEITVRFLDGDDTIVRELSNDGVPERILVTTTPFGRPFSIKSQGYLAGNFTVFPMVGITVRLNEDLRPAPSVLFRPHWKALRVLEDGGSITVRLAEGGEILAKETGKRASFVVGTVRSFTPDNLGMWRLELLAEQMAPNIEARTLLEWSRPVFLAPGQELNPGMVLEATITTGSGTKVAEIRYTLGRERLADVPINLVLEETPP